MVSRTHCLETLRLPVGGPLAKVARRKPDESLKSPVEA